MQAREDFHKADSEPRGRVLALASALLCLACSNGGEPTLETAARDGRPQLSEAPIASTPAPPAGQAWVIFGSDTVVAEVAATSDERARGLMYRDDVPDGTGMLFVFPDLAVRGFWMANTYVPLDLAFMDASFKVVDIVQMEPEVTETYDSRAPFMYGLEVRQGWLDEHGIAVGAQPQVVFGVTGR